MHVRSVRASVFTILTCVALVPGSGVLAAQNAPTQSQSAAAGSRVYGAKGCGECHAINGIGGTTAPDFAELRQKSLYELVAAMWDHLPQMTSRFAAADATPPRLDPWEAADLMAFLFWASASSPSGNPEVGQRLFTERTCVACHQVDGVGGVLGPALDGIASRFSAIDLAAALWNHAGRMEDGIRARGLERPVLIGSDIEHLVAYFGTASGGADQVRVNVLSGDPRSGRALFRERGCVRCHGGGAGGAPDLGRVARRDPLSFAAAMWNKGPRMMAAMRGQGIAVPRLTGAEMADLTAYFGTLQYVAGEGTAAAGARVVQRAGCNGCHRAGAAGPAPGRPLERMPHIDDRAAVIAALWNHVGLDAAALQAGWRALSPADVADLVAYFETRGAVR